MVAKDILVQYVDLKEEIKELKGKIASLTKQIERMEEEGCVVDKVMGGEGGIQSYKIQGFPVPEYSKKRTLLFERKILLQQRETTLIYTENQIEEFVSSIEDSHIRRIFQFRILEGLSWNKVACMIGGGNTEDSVRKAFERFLNN